MPNQQQIRSMIETARSSLGTPFVPRGRDLKKGLDCAGLVTVSARIQGLKCAALDAVSFTPYFTGVRRVTEGLERSDMVRVSESETRAGDVVLFHIWSPGHPLMEHLGLITDTHPSTFIHASPPALKGMVIEHELDAPLYPPIPTPWSFFLAALTGFYG